MMATPHALLGAALVLRVKPWPLGLALAVGSHLVLDRIPAWDVWFTDSTSTMIIFADIALVLVVLELLGRRFDARGRLLLTAGAFAGLAPDALTFLRAVTGLDLLPALHALHMAGQSPADPLWSIPLQCAVALAAGVLVSRSTRFSRPAPARCTKEKRYA